MSASAGRKPSNGESLIGLRPLLPLRQQIVSRLCCTSVHALDGGLHYEAFQCVLRYVTNLKPLFGRDLNRAKARAEQDRLRQRLEEKARFADDT
jgi:hypothetical protein